MRKRLLLGTTNPAKIASISHALASLPLELVLPRDVGVEVEVVEDGLSTLENAKKKACVYLAASGLPTLAVDGGLRVERFPEEKQPGVFVKRVHGSEQVTDLQVLTYYAHELEQVGGESRGWMEGSAVLAVSAAELYSSTATFPVLFTMYCRPILVPGAPLDSLMIDPETRKFYADMMWEERPYSRWARDFVQEHMAALYSPEEKNAQPG